MVATWVNITVETKVKTMATTVAIKKTRHLVNLPYKAGISN